MTTTPTFFNDPNLQFVKINNFSPGIVKYSLGNFPVTYAPEAPLGSASKAYRCINIPGIGLAPIFSYIGQPVSGGGPIISSTQQTLCVGLGVLGPATDQGVGYVPSQYSTAATHPVPNDYIYAAWLYPAGSNNWTIQTGRYYPLAALNYQAIQAVTTSNFGVSTNFAVNRTTSTAGSGVPPQIWWSIQDSLNYSPNWNGTGAGSIFGTTTLPYYGILTGAHESRTFATVMQVFNDIDVTSEFAANEDIYYTDPPEALTVNPNPNIFIAEMYSGYGAWGSVSTGELLLVKAGAGAVIITGDLAAPGSADKLPGVEGTGAILQEAKACAAGMIYVTESNGVWAWNGNNVSTKVSQQIPDDACVRSELAYYTTGGQSSPVYGPRSWHDVQAGLVFFANNWVFDSVNNSWWQVEDPLTVTFGAFKRSAGNSRFLYAMPISQAANTRWVPYVFDFFNRATSFEWTSNPIPVMSGTLCTLQQIEVVVSNPSSTPALITVTPTVPAGQSQYITQSTDQQKVNFAVPPTVSGWRQSIRTAFTDYNICIDVIASGEAGRPAPVIHEINLGYIVGNPR